MDRLAERIDQLTPLQRAAFLLKDTQGKLAALQKAQTEPIAIVGIACRFPGQVHDASSFWGLLSEGRDAVGEIPRDRWDVDAYYDPDPRAPGKMNTRWGGFLDKFDEFDNTFFGISAQEAARVDPQQRLLLELAWEALEDAGIVPEQLSGSKTGVFVGISISEYGLILSSDLNLTDAFVGTGTSLSIAANRVSYALDLRGPSVALDTACSSSLVGVHLACQSLRSGESHCALAGGVNMILTPTPLVNLTKAGFTSADGRCRSFDAHASGYVRSEGGGVVVLKTLSNAIADNDPIYSIILGSAVNQDGHSNGLTAPNRPAQEAVLREAYERAQIKPSKVQYVETQGTGTLLGDAIEVQALNEVLKIDRPAGQPLAIGSVKTNLGHLEAAAGMAGLIKVALSLKHGTIPPSLHFNEPNPLAPFDEIPIEVPTIARPFTGDEPATAAVSAFGFGGTNAHMVLQAAPKREAVLPRQSKGPRAHLLAISAKTAKALQTLAERYRDLLKSAGAFEEVCASAGLHRQHHDHRLAIVAANAGQAIERLDAFLRGEAGDGVNAGVKPYGQTLPSIRVTEILNGTAGAPSEKAINEFARLYATGSDIPFDRVYVGQRAVAKLPAYPWQRQRFWVDSDRYFPHSFGSADKTKSEEIAVAADPTAQFLFEMRWSAKPLASEITRNGHWLLLDGEGNVGKLLEKELAATGNSVTLLSDCNRLESTLKTLAESHEADWMGIVDLRACDDNIDAVALCSRTSELVRKLVVVAGKSAPKIWTITRQAMAVDAREGSSVAGRALWGLGRTLAQETPRHWGGLIDIDSDNAVTAIANQITHPDGEEQIALRQSKRLVARLVQADADTGKPFAWRADATYLLTGGLGGLGVVVARGLIEQGARRFLIVGRTEIPARGRWSSVDADSPVGRKIAIIRELEALGASIHLATADVADETAMTAIVSQFDGEGYPPIRGVIHLADEMQLSTVGGLTEEHYQHLFHAKVDGAQTLQRVLGNRPLDCFILFSSSASILPSPLMGGIGAANAALDALAQNRRSQGLPVTCINWCDWSQQSLVDRRLKQQKLQASRNLKGVGNQQALTILKSAIEADRAQTIVIPLTAEEWFRRPAAPLESFVREELARRQPAVSAAIRTRPELSVPFVAPATELEKHLADLWKSALKLDRVGLHDNFFELGGDSLQGAVLLNRIQEHLKEVIHPHVLFETQNINDFAGYLRKEHPAAVKRNFPTEHAGAVEDWDPDWPATIEEPEVERARELVSIFVPRKDPAPSKGPKNRPAIFVLSPPRSGSTLFRVMLAGHPDLFAPPELEMLPFDTLADRAAAYGNIASSWLEGADRALMEVKGYTAEEARATMQKLEASGMTTKDFYKVLQDAVPGRILVDKTPSNATHVKSLRRAEGMFENALYIHLLRHPCAMILSYIEYKMHQTYVNRYGIDKKFPFAPRQMGELVWNISNHNILRFLEQVPAERHCQVRFEELVTQPEETLQALCNFLKIDYIDDMAHPYRNKEGRMTSGTRPEKRMHGDQKFLVTHKSVDPTVADRWKQDMSADVLGNPAREMAAMLGYTDVPSPRIRAGMAEGLATPASGMNDLDQMSEADLDSLLSGMMFDAKENRS